MREKHSVIMRLVLVCMAFFCLTASAQTIVVDADTDEPVLYASVFDKTSGKYIGNTDGSGTLPEKAGEAQTITLQHLNYTPADVEMATVTGGKIRLTPLVHNVKEVAVDKGQHDYLRMKVYVRQLAWMTDTLAKVSRTVCNVYFKARKKGGYSYSGSNLTVLSRETLYNTDVLSRKDYKLIRGILNYNPRSAMLISGAGKIKKLPEEKVKRVEISNLGKNWGLSYARFDWKNNRCSYVEDSIRFLKPFTIPFLGYSIGHIFTTETYDIKYGVPRLANLVNLVHGFRLTHKKSKTSVDLYNEVFVLGVDYASQEDLEEDKLAQVPEGTEEEDFEEPSGYMPLNENVRKAMLTMRTLTYEEKKEILDEEKQLKKNKKEKKEEERTEDTEEE